MAYITQQQADRIKELRLLHGKEIEVRIQITGKAHGIVRIKWSMETEMLGLGPYRTIYLLPNGRRLTWMEPEFIP